MSSIKSMYTTIAGVIQEERRIQGIGSNIANVNTTGFKRQMVLTNEYNNERGVTPDNLTYMSYNFTQGGITQTGSMLDMALNGEGFFQVQLPDGTTGYHRGGNLGVNEENILVTNEGYPVLAQNQTTGAYETITILPHQEMFVSSRDGEFSINDTDYDFNLVDFEDKQQLERVDNNTFRTDAETIDSTATIYQGYVELSNVDTSQEFTDLLIANRQLQANYNALKTVDELVQKNIEEVGKL